MRNDQEGAALDRFERAVELPLLVLALALVPLLLVPELVDLSGPTERTLVTVDWLIWAAFAFEYVVRLALAPRRWKFVKREWPDLLLVALPILRPLRIARSARALRALRLVRTAAALAEVGQAGARMMKRHRLHYAVLATMAVIVACAGLVLVAEEDGGGAIDSLGDALWWAITTVTTVGYGDTFPVTPAGRGIAALLMLTGIAFFGVLTANIAAFFLETGDADAEGRGDRLDEILRRLESIERRLEASRAASPHAEAATDEAE